MYKITHDLVPQILSESFCSQNQGHYSLRNRANIENVKYIVKTPKTSLFQRSFVYDAVTKWNNLSASVKNIKKTRSLQTYLKVEVFIKYEINLKLYCMYVYVCVCRYVYVCMCICLYMYVCIYKYVCISCVFILRGPLLVIVF